MSDVTAEVSTRPAASPGRRRGRLPLLALGGVLLLGGGAAGAWFFVPGIADGARGMLAGVLGPTPAPAVPAPKPAFVELPEMTLTLPNGGRPRQLRLALSIEIMGDAGLVQPMLVGPRVYDNLILYLRTLRDGELEGALAIDRLRSDLFRRLEVLLGPDVVRDVLITGFTVA